MHNKSLSLSRKRNDLWVPGKSEIIFRMDKQLNCQSMEHYSNSNVNKTVLRFWYEIM